MSNLSDIGFPVRTEQDVNTMIESLIEQPLDATKCIHGFYLNFTDASGAAIYLQGSRDQELIGFNPHYEGASRREVVLLKEIERDSSPLDGGYVALSNAKSETGESFEFQFVFDAPDFRLNGAFEYPKSCIIQLSAFASNDFVIYANQAEFARAQESEIDVKSFFASGLYLTRDNEIPVESPRPVAVISGEIKASELKTNRLSNENFYWLTVETAGGDVDVAADAKLIMEEPRIGGIVSGQFWLSGRIVDE